MLRKRKRLLEYVAGRTEVGHRTVARDRISRLRFRSRCLRGLLEVAAFQPRCELRGLLLRELLGPRNLNLRPDSLLYVLELRQITFLLPRHGEKDESPRRLKLFGDLTVRQLKYARGNRRRGAQAQDRLVLSEKSGFLDLKAIGASRRVEIRRLLDLLAQPASEPGRLNLRALVGNLLRNLSTHFSQRLHD